VTMARTGMKSFLPFCSVLAFIMLMSYVEKLASVSPDSRAL
jgi:hypothetical protein